MDRKTEFSIIIPSYNSERTIAGCLDSLVRQADLETTEIIVVNSSRDSTPRIVEERFPEVTLIQSDKRRSAGEARNMGVQRAKGRVLLFIDSDCIADPDWISRMISAHAEGGYIGVGGGILNGNPVHEDMVEQAKMAGLNFIINVLLNRKGEITHVVAGDFIKAHEKGCQIEKEIAGVNVDHQVDITITSNGGAPLDLLEGGHQLLVLRGALALAVVELGRLFDPVAAPEDGHALADDEEAQQ